MQTRMTLLTVAILGLGIALAYSSRAAEPPAVAAAQKEQAVTPEQALQRLKAGNNRFAAEMSEKPNLSASRRQELVRGQAPIAAVLTCADSRVPPEHIFNQGLGDLFVVRVAGNIADPFQLGSLEYAVEHLHAPLIVLLGHTNCGAVDAALGKEKPPGNLGKVIGEIEVGRDLPGDKQSALAAAIKRNVQHQMRLLTERSPVIREHLEKKKIRIVSGVYQLATGKVEWLEEK